MKEVRVLGFTGIEGIGLFECNTPRLIPVFLAFNLFRQLHLPAHYNALFPITLISHPITFALF